MNNSSHINNLIRHYKKDANIYDFNRRFFLFGRNRLIRLIDDSLNPSSILEIGCGTGINLLKLHNIYPNTSITGLDVSQEMLKVARLKSFGIKNISLINDFFDENTSLPKFDLILCSYTISTIPNIGIFLNNIKNHLTKNGHFACVDFHSTNITLFKRWISHSIPIETHFPEHLLEGLFTVKRFEIRRAYGGVWKYFNYIGQKR